jgi:hypothetical protein
MDEPVPVAPLTVFVTGCALHFDPQPDIPAYGLARCLQLIRAAQEQGHEDMLWKCFLDEHGIGRHFVTA